MVETNIQTVTVADVALDPKAGGASAIYTYLAEISASPGENCRRGDAVLIPLGSRELLGYVLDVRTVTEDQLGFPLTALKHVRNKIEGLQIPEPVMNTVDFVSRTYLCSIPVALGPAAPPGVQDRMISVWNLTGKPEPQKLSLVQKEILRTLADSGDGIEESKTRNIEAGTLKALKDLRKLGLAKQTLRLRDAAGAKRADQTYGLTPETAMVEKFLTKDGKKKPAQAVVLMQLQFAQGSAFTSSEIRAMAGVTETTVKALVNARLLLPIDADERRSSMRPPPDLNGYQSIAVDAITAGINGRNYRPFLLYGVTGSGKTEVFLRSAAAAVQAGRQILYLVPEIALATQAIAQLRDRFGSSVAVIHSELSPIERLNNWMRIRSGEASIVLGARSALFAPLTNIGLIVVDEEHEGGYKQESAPRYHAREVARFLGTQHQCPVVLGSATPSIETFYECEQNEAVQNPQKLTLLTLPARAASAQLPTVFIENLADGYKPGGSPGLLSRPLAEKLTATLEAGNQAILFLNRRAYAPFLNCRTCGNEWRCPSCAVSLSYHRRENKLKCHHCGYQIPHPTECPACGGTKIKPFGVGTEKVEESIQLLYPEARVGRLDRDVAQKKGMLEQTLADFRAGQLNVLVGTQMVAKGLDFPNVTLVGVIAADISLNLPDFRSTERTYQLLTQVAGRAGRGSKPGEVVIQTFNPETVALKTAQKQDYQSLYDQVIVERREAVYPPFCRLVNILISSESYSVVAATGSLIANGLKEFAAYTVLGPTDCPLEKLNNRFRRHLLIKCDPAVDLRPIQIICDAAQEGPIEGSGPTHERPNLHRQVQVIVDVDAYNLM